MRRPCPSPSPSRRPVPGALVTPFVDTLADALVVVDGSSGGAPFGSFVLLLDEDDRLLAVVELTDAATDVDGLVAACVALADAATGTRWSSTVLASDRSGLGALATGDDRDGWTELVRSFRDAGIGLVDWLLVDGDLVGSLAGQVDGVDAWATGGG
jgi:hypothetical protein